MQLNQIYKAIKYLIVGGGIIKILSLASVFLIVKCLGIYNFGEYTITIAAISLFGVFYRVISGQIYQIELSRLLGLKEYNSAKILTKEVFFITTGITLFLVLLVFGTLLLINKNISIIHFKEYNTLILISAIYLFTLGYKNILVSRNRSFGMFKEQSYWDIADSFWRFLLILFSFLIIKNNITVLQIVFIDLIALVLGFLTYNIFFHNTITIGKCQEQGNVTSIFDILKKHGIWFLFRLLIVDFSVNTRLWIITFLLSVEAVGLYGLSKRIYQSAKVLLPLGVVFNSFYPKNSSNEINLRDLYIKCLNISWMLSFMVIILIYLSTIIIIPYIFPELGVTLQFLILISSCMYLFKPWTYSFISILSLDRKYKKLFLIPFILFISTLLFLPLFIKIAGIYGVALDVLLNSIIAMSLSYYFFIVERPSFSIKFNDFKEILKFKKIKEIKLLLKE